MLAQTYEEDGVTVVEFKYSTSITTMPFGKFKGTTIRDLPTSYLRWWQKEENNRKLKDAFLRFALNAEYEKRVKESSNGKSIEGSDGASDNLA